MSRTRQSLTREPKHGPQIESRPYGDRLRLQPRNSVVPGTADLRPVGVAFPQLLPHTIPPLDAYDYSLSSHPSFTPHHDEFLPPPQLAHPTYSLFPIEYSFSTHIPTTCWNQGLPPPFEFYTPWSPYNELHRTAPCNASPLILPTLQHNSACRQPSSITGDIQMGSVDVDEVSAAPSNYDPPVFSVPPSAPPRHDLDTTSKPHSATLDPSYPCQWTKDGIVCGAMVQAKRPHMNRHLHACHGFGGSETRQTRCHWVGCEATMQQGSIARHMVTCHLQAKVTCSMCSKKLSRQDVISKHQRVCPAAGTWG